VAGAMRITAPGLEHAGPAADVWLLPERAVFWPAARTLLVADLHWGKCETFRTGGAPLPHGLLEADLARLDAALRTTEAERLLVLGDLLHATSGITEWLVETVALWRHARPALAIGAIPGNHDRRISLIAEAWGLAMQAAELVEPPFAFLHDPGHSRDVDGLYAWAGHIHPMVTLRGRGDALRLPAFWMGSRVGVLPAFSSFTDGLSVLPEPGDAVYAIGPEGVLRAR
jgi:uncharacterized protein